MFFTVFQLIAAAKHFQLSRFLCDASQFAHDYLNVDKVFNLLEASADAGNEKIKANCVKFITDNEAKVFNSKGFKEISLKTLMCTFKHCDFEAGKRAEIVQKFNNREATPQVSENVTGCKPKDSKVKATPNQKQKVAAAKIPEPNITTSFEVVGPPLKSSNETAVKEEFEVICQIHFLLPFS